MGSQKDGQNRSLLNFLNSHRILSLIIFIILIASGYLFLSYPQLIPHIDWGPILQILFGGILGGVISSVIVFYALERYHLKKKSEEFLTLYTELFEKNSAFLESLPKAIGGGFTKSLFEYPPVVSNRLAKILSDKTDEWYQQYYKRVLVCWAKDIYKIVQVNKIEDAGTDMEGGSMEVWELKFLSTWEWSNDSKIVKFPLRDFMIAVTAPDVAIENLLDGPPHIIERKKKEFFDFIRNRNIVRSIILHKNVIQELSEQAILQMISIDEFSIDWADEGRTENIGVEEFEDISHKKDIPQGVYKAYKLPKDSADKPLEPGRKVIISYRGRISIPVINESNHRTGKLFLAFPDLIAKKYTLILNYPKNIGLEGIGKKVEIVEDKSGIWFGHERLTQPWSLPRGSYGELSNEFVPKNGEDVTRLEISEPLTNLNYSIIYWEEAN